MNESQCRECESLSAVLTQISKYLTNMAFLKIIFNSFFCVCGGGGGFGSVQEGEQEYKYMQFSLFHYENIHGNMKAKYSPGKPAVHRRAFLS